MDQGATAPLSINDDDITSKLVENADGRLVDGGPKHLLGTADQDGNPHEASHALAELYLPDFGWVGFDPANRCCPTDYYIRLGAGLDGQVATPIRGVHTGGANENLDVTVIIAQSQQ